MIVLALPLLFLVGLSCARNPAPWHTPVTPETVIPSICGGSFTHFGNTVCDTPIGGPHQSYTYSDNPTRNGYFSCDPDCTHSDNATFHSCSGFGLPYSWSYNRPVARS